MISERKAIREVIVHALTVMLPNQLLNANSTPEQRALYQGLMNYVLPEQEEFIHMRVGKSELELLRGQTLRIARESEEFPCVWIAGEPSTLFKFPRAAAPLVPRMYRDLMLKFTTQYAGNKSMFALWNEYFESLLFPMQRADVDVLTLHSDQELITAHFAVSHPDMGFHDPIDTSAFKIDGTGFEELLDTDE